MDPRGADHRHHETRPRLRHPRPGAAREGGSPARRQPRAPAENLSPPPGRGRRRKRDRRRPRNPVNASFDSGVLVRRYVLEANSPEAIAWIDAAGAPLPFSHHAVEIPSAIHLKRSRGELTPRQESSAIHALDADVEAGRLVRPDYHLDAMFFRAPSLSGRHSGRHGTRSMDLLHVAAALEAGGRNSSRSTPGSAGSPPPRSFSCDRPETRGSMPGAPRRRVRRHRA